MHRYNFDIYLYTVSYNTDSATINKAELVE